MLKLLQAAILAIVGPMVGMFGNSLSSPFVGGIFVLSGLCMVALSLGIVYKLVFNK